MAGNLSLSTPLQLYCRWSKLGRLLLRSCASLSFDVKSEMIMPQGMEEQLFPDFALFSNQTARSSLLKEAMLDIRVKRG